MSTLIAIEIGVGVGVEVCVEFGVDDGVVIVMDVSLKTLTTATGCVQRSRT